MPWLKGKHLLEKATDKALRLIGPVRFRDEEQHRVARMLCLILPCIMIGLIATGLLEIVEGKWQAGLAMLVGALLVAEALVQIRLGAVKAALITFSIALLFLTAYLVFIGRGIHDVAILIYPGMIIIGGMLMPRRAFLRFTLLSIFSITAVALAEIIGLIHTSFSGLTTHIDLIIIVIILIIIALAARLLIDDLRRTTDKARQSEQALRDSEKNFRQLVDNSLVGIYIIQNHIIRFCNRRMAEMFGYDDADEIIGTYIRGLIAPESWEVVDHELYQRESGIKESGQYGFACIRRDGVRFLAEEMGVRILFEGQPAVQGIIIDVTQRKLAEESLRESEERFRLLAEASFEGIAVIDQGKVIDLNSRLIRMLGYSPEEMFGMENIEFISPEDRSRVQEKISSGSDAPYEFQAIRKDGTRFPVEARNRTIPYKGTLARVTALKDLTAAKQAEEERRRFEIQMRQAQKMESLGTLAGGIAHDFNNILSIIIGYASTIPGLLSDPQKASHHTNTIIDAASRGSSLVKQILTFAQKSHVEMKPVDVNQIIAELVRMLKGTFPKTVEICLECDPSLPKLSLDVTQIHQALLNLCINARDAMEDRGRLVIGTAMVPGDRIAARFPDAAGRRFLQIRVNDNGKGMFEAVRQRIFEPFFTTKKKGKGTGLGLAVVFGVVQAHNGFIDVESQLGLGSTFYLYFPLREIAEVQPEKKIAVTTAPPGGKEVILVAEDEKEQLELLVMVLEEAGYSVITVTNGAEALSTFKDPPKKIDAVLTDFDLPRLKGVELCRSILGINPSAKLILISGFLEMETKSYLQHLGVQDFIQKPYHLADLLRTLRDSLDRK